MTQGGTGRVNIVAARAAPPLVASAFSGHDRSAVDHSLPGHPAGFVPVSCRKMGNSVPVPPVDARTVGCYAPDRGDLLPDCGPRKTTPLKRSSDGNPLSLDRDRGFFDGASGPAKELTDER